MFAQDQAEHLRIERKRDIHHHLRQTVFFYDPSSGDFSDPALVTCLEP
jgi:hypothetical protein